MPWRRLRGRPERLTGGAQLGIFGEVAVSVWGGREGEMTDRAGSWGGEVTRW